MIVNFLFKPLKIHFLRHNVFFNILAEMVATLLIQMIETGTPEGFWHQMARILETEILINGKFGKKIFT